MNTASAFDLSTSTAKRGRNGFSKNPGVVRCAYEIKADQKAAFVAAVSVKLAEVDAAREIANKRYARTNNRRDAFASIRLDIKAAAYRQALDIVAA
jgi:hypothetical protein